MCLYFFYHHGDPEERDPPGDEGSGWGDFWEGALFGDTVAATTAQTVIAYDALWNPALYAAGATPHFWIGVGIGIGSSSIIGGSVGSGFGGTGGYPGSWGGSGGEGSAGGSGMMYLDYVCGCYRPIYPQ